MREYILRIEGGHQGEALLTYLRSLAYVQVEPQDTAARAEAAAGMRQFLATLPEHPHTQEDVNQALEDLRQHG